MNILKIYVRILFSILIVFLVFTACRKKSDDSCPVCPVITGVSPDHGHYNDTVIISGSNFGSNPSAATIKFNGKVVETVDIISGNSSEIKVRVPLKCGTGPVSIALDADLFSDGGPTFTYEYNQVISVYAGVEGSSADPASPVSLSSPQFYNPTQIKIDNSGSLAILDLWNSKVKRFDPATQMFKTITGFTAPAAIDIDKDNILYIARYDIGGSDICNIYKSVSGSTVSSSFRIFDKTSAGGNLISITLDDSLNTYVAIHSVFEWGFLLKVRPPLSPLGDTTILSQPVISSICRKGQNVYMFCNIWTGSGYNPLLLRQNLSTLAIDTIVTTIHCNGVYGTAMALRGSQLYVADSHSGQLYFVNSSSALVPANPTVFTSIGGLAVDQTGDIYISETGKHCIKKLSFE